MKVKYTREEYRREYLKSEEWQKLRSLILWTDPYCQCCNKNKASEVHHMVYKNIVDVRVDELLPVCRDCHKLIHQAIKDGYISQNPKKLEEIKEKTVHILMDQDYIDLRKWLDGKHPLSADYIKIIREDNREFLIKRIRGITKKNVWYKDLESLRVTGRQLKKIRGLIETHLHREKRGLNSKKVVGRFKSRIIPKKRT